MTQITKNHNTLQTKLHTIFLIFYLLYFLFCFQLAETLFKKETLNYDDVEKLLGPPPHGKKKLIDPAEFEENVRKDAGDYKTRDAEANTPI